MSKSRFQAMISPLVFLACACGGPATTVVSASVAIPYDLLKVSSYDAILTLNDPTTNEVIVGPVPLLREDDESTWNVEMKDIDEREYKAIVEISVPISTGGLVLARAERPIAINKGAPYATLTFKPSDFDAELDDDLDAVFNVSEYLNGLNPHDEDTDHDGILDFDEIAPIEEELP